jgi:hypothetical protein
MGWLNLIRYKRIRGGSRRVDIRSSGINPALVPLPMEFEMTPVPVRHAMTDRETDGFRASGGQRLVQDSHAGSQSQPAGQRNRVLAVAFRSAPCSARAPMTPQNRLVEIIIH